MTGRFHFRAIIIGRVCVTWCNQAPFAPILDRCVTYDKEGHRYIGYCCSLPRKDKPGLTRKGIVVAWKR